MMEDDIHFQAPGVIVSTSRLVCGNTTYPIRNLTSVRMTSDQLSRIGELILIIVGMAFIIPAWYIGIPLTAAGFWLFNKKRKFRYNILICSSGGEKSAFTTHNAETAESIMNAINKAIFLIG